MHPNTLPRCGAVLSAVLLLLAVTSTSSVSASMQGTLMGQHSTTHMQQHLHRRSLLQTHSAPVTTTMTITVSAPTPTLSCASLEDALSRVLSGVVGVPAATNLPAGASAMTCNSPGNNIFAATSITATVSFPTLDLSIKATNYLRYTLNQVVQLAGLPCGSTISFAGGQYSCQSPILWSRLASLCCPSTPTPTPTPAYGLPASLPAPVPHSVPVTTTMTLTVSSPTPTLSCLSLKTAMSRVLAGVSAASAATNLPAGASAMTCNSPDNNIQTAATSLTATVTFPKLHLSIKATNYLRQTLNQVVQLAGLPCGSTISFAGGEYSCQSPVLWSRMASLCCAGPTPTPAPTPTYGPVPVSVPSPAYPSGPVTAVMTLTVLAPSATLKCESLRGAMSTVLSGVAAVSAATNLPAGASAMTCNNPYNNNQIAATSITATVGFPALDLSIKATNYLRSTLNQVVQLAGLPCGSTISFAGGQYSCQSPIMWARLASLCCPSTPTPTPTPTYGPVPVAGPSPASLPAPVPHSVPVTTTMTITVSASTPTLNCVLLKDALSRVLSGVAAASAATNLPAGASTMTCNSADNNIQTAATSITATVTFPALNLSIKATNYLRQTLSQVVQLAGLPCGSTISFAGGEYSCQSPVLWSRLASLCCPAKRL